MRHTDRKSNNLKLMQKRALLCPANLPNFITGHLSKRLLSEERFARASDFVKLGVSHTILEVTTVMLSIGPKCETRREVHQRLKETHVLYGHSTTNVSFYPL